MVVSRQAIWEWSTGEVTTSTAMGTSITADTTTTVRTGITVGTGVTVGTDITDTTWGWNYPAGS